MLHELESKDIMSMLKEGISIRCIAFVMEWSKEDIEKVLKEENIKCFLEFDPKFSLELNPGLETKLDSGPEPGAWTES